MSIAEKRKAATIEDWLTHTDEERLELIRGTLVPKAAPTVCHGVAQGGTASVVIDSFQRRGGGWWFGTEIDVRLFDEVVRPDVLGSRRSRVPMPPNNRLLEVAPDWICEVLSVSNESYDRVEKMQTYHRAGLPHYWLLDPLEGTLEVYSRTERAYELILSAHRGQRVRAEPFQAVEISVDELLGRDPPEGNDG